MPSAAWDAEVASSAQPDRVGDPFHDAVLEAGDVLLQKSLILGEHQSARDFGPAHVGDGQRIDAGDVGARTRDPVSTFTPSGIANTPVLSRR